MNSRKWIVALIVVAGIVVWSSCSEEERRIVEEIFIELDQHSMVLSLSGEEEDTLKLTANGAWEATGIPDWLTVTPSSGDQSSELILTAVKNKEPEGRTGSFTITAGEQTVTVEVKQFGLKDVIRGPRLPIFRFSETSFNTATEPTYSILTNSLFVNSRIKEKIYLGNLINPEGGQEVDFAEFSGYTFDPITVSTSAPVYSKTFVPSLEEQTTYAREIIATHPQQNVAFIADNGTVEFYTYKQLHATGMANLGVKLDEIVSGSSYKTKEMEKKYGIIYSFIRKLFTMDMDLPDNGKHIRDELKESDKAQDVSYVSSISYGKVGLLIVETDTYYEEVRSAINSVLSGESLSAEESALIEASNITYIYFDNDHQIQVQQGTRNAIDAYINGLNDQSQIYPVEFSLADMETHAVSPLSFSFTLTID